MPFLYRCPTNGLLVQGVLNPADEPIPAGGPPPYQLVDCTACGQPHMINPATAHLGEDGRHTAATGPDAIPTRERS